MTKDKLISSIKNLPQGTLVAIKVNDTTVKDIEAVGTKEAIDTDGKIIHICILS